MILCALYLNNLYYRKYEMNIYYIETIIMCILTFNMLEYQFQLIICLEILILGKYYLFVLYIVNYLIYNYYLNIKFELSNYKIIFTKGEKKLTLFTSCAIFIVNYVKIKDNAVLILAQAVEFLLLSAFLSVDYIDEHIMIIINDLVFYFLAVIISFCDEYTFKNLPCFTASFVFISMMTAIIFNICCPIIFIVIKIIN